MLDPLPRVGIVGGTGPLGRGLARRFAAGGVDVVLGSRDEERSARAATEVSAGLTTTALTGAETEPGRVVGAGNERCVIDSGLVLLAVPWSAHAATVASLSGLLAGKVLVDCVNPLGFDSQGPYALPVVEGSAAEQAQALAPQAVVTAAFHHLSAVTLLEESVASVDADVLVLGDDRSATDLVRSLADRIAGCRGVYAGQLRNAGQVEALTANLIAINRRYRAHAGLRVTDLPASD